MSSPPIGSDRNDALMEFAGALKKWTNYILGWQSRFFVLRQGNLMYYKSENDVRFGCRGAINLSNASLVAHKFDECRFDVHICDLIWYLRSECPDERQKWVSALTMHTRNPRITKNSIYPSTFCLTLREKLQDVKFVRDELFEKAEKLIEHLETPQSEESAALSVKNPEDIKTDLILFQDTVSELLSTMSCCVDLIDKRSKVLIFGRESSEASIISCSSDSPEMVEGRHCLLGDDEFFDALESGLDRIEEEAELRKRLECRSFEQELVTSEITKHPLWARISQRTEEQIKMATSGKVI